MARSGQAYEEVMRLVLQTSGQEGVEALQRALEGMGDGGEEAQSQISALFDEFAKARGLEKTARDFKELGSEVLSAGQRYRDLQQRTEEAAKQLAETENPTKRQQRQLAMLASELEKAGGELERSRGAWRQHREALESSGVATARYGDLQAQVAAKQAKATAQIKEFADGQAKAAAASRSTAGRLAEGDAEFRKFARAGTAAASSLDAYRDRAAAARAETANVAKEADDASGVFGRLRGVVAGVFGFLSVRSLLGGLKSVITEGSNAEQEFGQLNAVLASTRRESEFTAEGLAELADRLAGASKFAAGDIINAQTRLLSYTNILKGEFPDAMQIVIDQSARLGISLEQSAEIVGRSLQEPTKAMQALGRQGFVLEESQKQLLAQLEATGRTAEAQRIIMDLLVESYGGAAAAQKVGTIAGLWKAASESFKDFQQQISDRGVLDYFKAQLSELLDTTARLQRDGTLGRWAQQIADGIVRMASAAKDTALQLAPLGKAMLDLAGFAARNVEQIVLLAKAYAGLKLVQLVTQFTAVTNAKLADLVATRALTAANVANAASSVAVGRAANRAAAGLDVVASSTAFGRIGMRLRGLGQAISSVPRLLRITVAAVGVDWAVREMVKLKATIEDVNDARRLTEVHERTQRMLTSENLRLGGQLTELYKANANEAVRSAVQLAAMSKAEAEQYQFRLNEAAKYHEGLVRLARASGDAAAEAEAASRRRELLKGLQEVQGFLDSKRLPEAVRDIIAKLNDVPKSAQNATSKLSEFFSKLDFNDTSGLSNVARALANIGERSESAGKNVREGLEAALGQLSGDALLKLQTAAQNAFGTLEEQPRGAAMVLDTVLMSALKRLGVAAGQWGVPITAAGQDAIDSFTAVAQAATATSAQIEAAFKAALSLASTEAEAQALGEVMKAAGEQGRLGFDAAARSAAALRARLGDIKGSLDPLADEFKRLGITSKAELDRTRDATRDAFDAIRRAYGRGEAAIEDVRAAVRRYADSMRAAAEDSDAAAKRRVDAEIRVLEATFSVNRALEDMAGAGERAGDAIADGAGRATSALEGTQNAAVGAQQSLDGIAAGAAQVGQAAAGAASQTRSFGLALGSLSEAGAKLLTGGPIGSPGLWSRWLATQTAIIQGQQDQVRRMKADVEAQLAAMDPLADKLGELGRAFNYVGEQDLRQLAEMQVRLADETERARAAKEAEKAADRQQREERAAAAAERRNQLAAELEQVEAISGASKPSAIPSPMRTRQSLEVVLRADPSAAAKGLGLSQRELADLARDLTPLVIRELEISRIGSMY